MTTQQLIDNGKTHATDLNDLIQRLRHSREHDYASLDLNETERGEKESARQSKIAGKIADAEAWVEAASDRAAEIAPNIPPRAAEDSLTRYRAEHRLYALSPDERRVALDAAIAMSDSTTYEVALETCRTKPWLRLFTDAEVRRTVAKWGERHTVHGGPGLAPLRAVLGDVQGLLAELKVPANIV